VQGNAQVKHLNRNARATVLGTSITYFGVRSFEVERGRAFTEGEVERAMRVAVLGPATAESLFGTDDPLGQTVKLNGINFRVLGVLKSKGDQGWFNPDDQVIVPYSVAMKQLFGLNYLREVDVQAAEDADLDDVEQQVSALLRRRHRLQPEAEDDFEIRNQAEILETASSVSRTFTVLLGGIASISLLVGGIGIMNIMLVTVTERTREIGVRKAIGAKDRDILRQFLIESLLMSGLGGLLGVALGVGGAAVISRVSQFGAVVELSSVLLSLSFSAGVGIFFGYYPARRAARLDAIEALRYE
jgi:putative ABC transport system permease protein